jgi:tetratricopeptide (TPR) repeat protein
VNLRHTPVARFTFALLAIAACLLLMREAARIGFSRLLTRYAIASNSLPAADQAVQLTPSDAEAHRARATVLNRLRRPAEAKSSLEAATTLRPRDDRLWIELGNTREELGDNEGALAALNEAVRWAPYYERPRWQRGNLLLRMGRYDEAFADLREAAASNRKLLPNLMDVAWGLTRADATRTETLLEISNDKDRLAFARFLAEKGRGVDVVEQVRLLATPLSDENTKELMRLLSKGRDVSGPFRLGRGIQKVGEIINGGFEEPVLLNNSPVGWIVSHSQTRPMLTLDVSERAGGKRSLQVSVGGEWDASAPTLSQNVVVQPGQRYRLSFAVKTNDLVTGGPPLIQVRDTTKDQVLAQSDTFQRTTNSWQQKSVEFTVPSNSTVVVINLTREKCASDPCPIFGVMWIDEFALEKL